MNLPISLQTPLQYIKGVGPERSKTLARLGLTSIEDALYFFPRRYEDRFPIKKISELVLEEKGCVSGLVQSRGLIRTKFGQSIFKVVIHDGASTLFGVWFNQPYLNKIFLPKSKVVFYGKAEKEGKHLKMVHPEYELLAEAGPAQTIHSGRIVPIYPLTEDLSQKGIRQFLFRVIAEHARLVKEPLAAPLRRRLTLKDRARAIREIHFPPSEAERRGAYERLVFDEFFFMQLMIQIKKAELQKENKQISHRSGEEKVSELIRSLGFELTGGQTAAIREILDDMKRERPMNRLVQGDVGSGKTAVAAAALTFTAANGFQGALMAPTEVLAQQHYFNLTQMLEPMGIVCGYLANELSLAEKDRVIAGLMDGRIQVVIGTHSLIQDAVKFKNLGLVVIDEQHKFGVFQRAALKEKAKNPPHFLLMTATPIPRTLSLTLYGDLDISVIAELPKGRKSIKTLWVGENKRKEVYEFLDQEIQKGNQGYVICPLIEEKKEFSPKSVSAAYQELSEIFSHRKVGILHGRMKSDEKKRVMKDFKDKRIEILVSTVVIEVGVDVPNASVMIIENADKFGLAQLHQLRGRVGRGAEESTCVLFSETTNPESAERLGAFESMSSGFDIAETDLNLRGAGEIVGKKQHGAPELKIGDLTKDLGILIKAKREAVQIVERDARLESSENRPLRQAIRERYGWKAMKKIPVSA